MPAKAERNRTVAVASRITITRSKRRTLAISVLPSGDLELRAPLWVTEDQISKRLAKRSRWIQTQRRYFEAHRPKTREPRYVSGESHRYLGRQYRLKVNRGSPANVRITRGFITITIDEKLKPKIHRLFDKWLRDRATIHFKKRVLELSKRLKLQLIPPENIKLRRMSLRWGSCTADGIIYFNPELIKKPIGCIDYVIVHELCHLREPNHGKRFYRLLQSVLPNWQRLKRALEVS